MKKLLASTLIVFIFLFEGCGLDDPKYIHFDSKPNNNYYTNLIKSKLINNEDYTIDIFDKNMHKSINIDDSEKIVIKYFLDSLTPDNYQDSIDLPETEIYQIRIVINNEKYLIKIYDKNIITINPWDGKYQKDIILMNNIPVRYNLYNFCVHVQYRDIYRR